MIIKYVAVIRHYKSITECCMKLTRACAGRRDAELQRRRHNRVSNGPVAQCCGTNSNKYFVSKVTTCSYSCVYSAFINVLINSLLVVSVKLTKVTDKCMSSAVPDTQTPGTCVISCLLASGACFYSHRTYVYCSDYGSLVWQYTLWRRRTKTEKWKNMSITYNYLLITCGFFH